MYKTAYNKVPYKTIFIGMNLYIFIMLFFTMIINDTGFILFISYIGILFSNFMESSIYRHYAWYNSRMNIYFGDLDGGFWCKIPYYIYFVEKYFMGNDFTKKEFKHTLHNMNRPEDI
jgi:hypothetical protein